MSHWVAGFSNRYGNMLKICTLQMGVLIGLVVSNLLVLLVLKLDSIISRSSQVELSLNRIRGSLIIF